MPNLILHNGKFITQDPDFSQVTALAIREDRVLALGADAEIRALARPHTRLIDLEGYLVLPTDRRASSLSQMGARAPPVAADGYGLAI